MRRGQPLPIKLGMPKNKQFHRLNEVLPCREVDKFDLEMNSDFNKEQPLRSKEELYYVIDESSSRPISLRGSHL